MFSQSVSDGNVTSASSVLDPEEETGILSSQRGLDTYTVVLIVVIIAVIVTFVLSVVSHHRCYLPTIFSTFAKVA